MAKMLVHIHTGPDNPTKAALGFLVAATAIQEGHHVDLFLAGDGVLLLSKDVLGTLEGKGTGKLQSHFEAITKGSGRFYLSGMSAKARGMDATALEGKPAEFAMPDVLVKLAVQADTVLTY
jgi:predicted peroxiredoxin